MPEIPPIPLAELTTLRTGGVPERMFAAHTSDELVAALRDAWASGEPLLVLGGGSNLFVGDEPLEGTVIRVLTTGIEMLPSPRAGFARLRVQAGHDWDALVAFAVGRGLGGIEAMSGIPGTVGAAPVQNIGAYGQEIVQTLVDVELIDELTGEIATVPAADLGLGFRTSVLKHHYGFVPERPAVILTVTLELEAVGSDARPVGGEQLRTALGLEPTASVSIAWVREQVLATRRRKGMVLEDADPDTHSAGSFFQNAIVSASFARTLPPECPRWPVTPDLDSALVIPLAAYAGYVPPTASQESDVKVSAAWLIEHSGLRKGFRLPRSRAALSTKHALALTNRGGASAEEIAQLARFIQGRVQAEFGLVLQPEPVLVGVEL
ncbi:MULTISPECIES: UDP-N-acetylmuramate dehydrogenase [unclassified Microbacterium]|uniref:UDP-N-acetylmuramate dehydrogenase n=1 Tax=unclassified Microbacterium TaxID=2609290 RepID=UPI00214B511B|nr:MULTISPECIES: UDP-N-acetylmuramate dehydrogenase [unclassified Microbacterium]MCR2811228.1 UDP-N-acetylmuramate dehydrogenase [Microbacterium sp. zg.B185]WIM19827.1 UDP-N-acetylmuramate dehydrogenase [Microbacterium sp. zg-B185]